MFVSKSFDELSAAAAADGCTVPQDTGAGRWLCRLQRLGETAEALPGTVADFVSRWWWPWLPVAVVVAVAGYVMLGAAHRAVWRRAAGSGFWVRVVPPRAVDADQSGNVWRLLAGVVRRAAGPWWWPLRLPVAFEIHAAGGRLVAGLWVPG
ncbi:MAG: hypothetical protein ACRDQ7_18590, partial [Haloechinothrix sp.]